MAWPDFPPTQLHSVLVHVPIVLVPAAALLATLSKRFPWAWPASQAALVAGALGAIGALVTGLSWHAQVAPNMTNVVRKSLLSTHRILGFAVVGLVTALALVLWLRRDAVAQAPRRTYWLTALWIATALVLLAAWFGGGVLFDRLKA